MLKEAWKSLSTYTKTLLVVALVDLGIGLLVLILKAEWSAAVLFLVTPYLCITVTLYILEDLGYFKQ